MKRLLDFGYKLRNKENYSKLINKGTEDVMEIFVLFDSISYEDEYHTFYSCCLFNLEDENDEEGFCNGISVNNDCDLEFVLNLEKLLTKTK